MRKSHKIRISSWPVTTCDSRPVGVWQAWEISILDYHELAAGKLAALLARRQARDLFDSVQIFRMDNLDPHRLRLGFVVYGAMNRMDWRTVSTGDVNLDPAESARQLIPTMRANAAKGHSDPAEYGARLLEECQRGLSAVLPFR